MIPELAFVALCALVVAHLALKSTERDLLEKGRLAAWRAFAERRGLTMVAPGDTYPTITARVHDVPVTMALQQALFATSRDPDFLLKTVVEARRTVAAAPKLVLTRRAHDTPTRSDDVDPGSAELRNAFVVRAGSGPAFFSIIGDEEVRRALQALAPGALVMADQDEVRVEWPRAHAPETAWTAAAAVALLAKHAFAAAERGPSAEASVLDGFHRDWRRRADAWSAFAKREALSFECGESHEDVRALPWLSGNRDGVRVELGLVGDHGEHAVERTRTPTTVVRGERIASSSVDRHSQADRRESRRLLVRRRGAYAG